MLEKYLIVHKSILPDYYEKVVRARRLIESGEIKDVSTAVKQVGISRSTYYKYKDYVLEPSDIKGGRIAVLSMVLNHEPGVLGSLLLKISEAGGSVLTITQSIPIHKMAEVMLSIDVASISMSTDELLNELNRIPGVENPRLLAIE